MNTDCPRFDTWVREAAAGEVFAYHTGFLAIDRGEGQLGDWPMAAAAWEAYELGYAELTQAKITDQPGGHFYIYLATRTTEVYRDFESSGPSVE